MICIESLLQAMFCGLEHSDEKASIVFCLQIHTDLED